MSGFKLAAIVLIAAGLFGLAYRTFSYTRETHTAKLGSLELSVKDRQTIDVPVWASLGAVVLGGALLLGARRRS